MVERIAREVGIETWWAELKPTDKIAWLDQRAAEGRKVLMIGDGLNDAPALAAAHASMSPASAADISQRAADFIFQGEKLAPIARRHLHGETGAVDGPAKLRRCPSL